MNKKILLTIGIMVLLVGLVTAGLFGFNVLRTYTEDLDGEYYCVEVEGYEDTIPCFNISEVNTGNINQKISDRLDIIDYVNAYNQKVKDGKSACTLDSSCRTWGWNETTAVCDSGRCYNHQDEVEDNPNHGSLVNQLNNALGV